MKKSFFRNINYQMRRQALDCLARQTELGIPKESIGHSGIKVSEKFSRTAAHIEDKM